MKRHPVLIFFILMLSAAFSHAQTNTTAQYVIPRLVYVGDPAVLILPLPGSAAQSVSLNALSPHFPRDINIDFHSVTLERAPAGSRLLIEFTAFAPGLHFLPVIEIGGERFSGLTVSIGSVIDSRSAPTLSGPASSLAMPGTALMLYGTIACLVFGLLLAIWFTLKGRHYLRGWSEKFKRWQLFVYMKGMEKRLQKAMLRGEDKRAILDILSEKFRIFLSSFTGNNCRAMTAGEFEKFSFPEKTPANSSVFLGNFFRRCDELRFSGADIGQEDIFKLLADLQFYLTEFENAAKETDLRLA